MDALVLRRTPQSGDLVPLRLAPLLGRWSEPRAALQGQELRLARSLSLDDPACVGFVLDFVGQGARVEVTAHGASAPLLIWAFHALASGVKAELVAPSADLRAALEYLAAYEKDVMATRDAGLDLDGEAFVAWLVREEALALGGPPGDFADLPLEDASSMYERLLDSDKVEDLFVSERELARLLQRFLARRTPR